MKQSCILLLLLVALLLPLCSFVSSDTASVYVGSVQQYGSLPNGCPQLSGGCLFTFYNLDSVCLNDSSYLMNNSSTTLSGLLKMDNSDIEYPIRFTSGGELEIYQTYYNNGRETKSWVTYHLSTAKVPTNTSPIETFFLISFTVIVLLLIVILIRG